MRSALALLEGLLPRLRLRLGDPGYQDNPTRLLAQSHGAFVTRFWIARETWANGYVRRF